ncbi:hypothetical protein PUR28_11395 [Streptomyces sp. BE308]|nr:hypothetical protein [Streptomyces sp. BE308]MEE1791366.1 hypothetical protein [Streptomyces sp. BE308]
MAALWAAVEEVAPRATVVSAAATVVTLVPEDENSAEVAMRAALANRYATVRPFLALLGESKALDAASAGKRVLAGAGRTPGGPPLRRAPPAPGAAAARGPGTPFRPGCDSRHCRRLGAAPGPVPPSWGQ